MNTKLYVGNLAFGTSKADLESLFATHGSVTEIHLPLDRETGRTRGFAFVTMASPEGAQAAAAALNGCEVGGRFLSVAAARERSESSSRGQARGRY